MKSNCLKIENVEKYVTFMSQVISDIFALHWRDPNLQSMSRSRSWFQKNAKLGEAVDDRLTI